MVRYVKCPRCELNYIDADKQEYCDVCLAEMHGDKLQFADLDDDELEEIDAELEQSEICPVCGVNTLHYGEKMCESCRQKSSEYETEEDIDIDKDEEWKNYLDEDDGDLTVDDEEMEELDAELDEEEEEETEENFDDDDFFDEDLESLSDLEDEEDLDDEEEDDDDDDF